MNYQISKIVLSNVFCSICSLITAQTIDMATEANIMSRNVSSTIRAEGSPYIDENYSSIRISQFNDKIYNARFNAFNNEMEIMTSEDKVIALDNNGDFEVIFNSKNKTYKTTNYTTQNGISKRGFLLVLDKTESYTLFKEEKIEFYEKVRAASSYQTDKPPRFQRVDDIYYLKLNDTVTFLPQKKRDFLKVFTKHEKKLKSYMKKNNVNPKNEDELLTLVKYLATL